MTQNGCGSLGHRSARWECYSSALFVMSASNPSEQVNKVTRHPKRLCKGGLKETYFTISWCRFEHSTAEPTEPSQKSEQWTATRSLTRLNMIPSLNNPNVTFLHLFYSSECLEWKDLWFTRDLPLPWLKYSAVCFGSRAFLFFFFSLTLSLYFSFFSAPFSVVHLGFIFKEPHSRIVSVLYVWSPLHL